MKVTKFIKKKNAIIHKLTGITLVPESQIQKVPKFPLDLESGASSCPYCPNYSSNALCFGCPMSGADNQCYGRYNNTWEQLDDWVDENTKYSVVSDWYQSIPEMVKLYKKYNKQFKDK